MSVSNVHITPANAFVGLAGDVNRVAVITNARRADKQRELWVRYVLPLVNEEFISSVIKSDAFCKIFKLDVPEEFDMSIPWKTFSHVAAFQNLSQFADSNVPLRLVPWQLRFEFAKEVHTRLLTTTLQFDKEVKAHFRNCGWHFWTTRTGFCICPLNVYEELRSIVSTFSMWTQEIADMQGAGFADFGEDAMNAAPAEAAVAALKLDE